MPGAFYSVRGLTGATVGTADHAIFAVWNPSTTKRIELLEIGVFTVTAGTAGCGFYRRRITARGTAGSTATPSLENALERDAAPDSGFLLDLAAYSVQPTLAAAPGMGPSVAMPNSIGAGIIIPFAQDLIIPPGTGIAFLNRAAVIFPASEVWVRVSD